MLNGIRVLIVEDEALIAATLADAVGNAGGEVVGVACTLSEARELIRRLTFDAAVLDLHLPDGDVTPVLEALHARRAPIVVYSGSKLPEKVRARHPELVALQKPALPGRLVAEILRARKGPLAQYEQVLRSITAHRAISGLPNLLVPLSLNAAAPEWPIEQVDAVVAINMVHISPLRATQGLMAGAGRVLSPGGVLYLYGAYKENGAHTAPSNAAFDLELRRHNPGWGVRDLEEVVQLAEGEGLTLVDRIIMPANNLSLIFRK